MKYLKWIFLLLALALGPIYLLRAAYSDVREQMVAELYSQEMILARQAAKAIENLFETYWFALDSLSKNVHVINLDPDGRELLKDFYIRNSSLVASIAMVSSSGEVLYSYPNTRIIGMNLSSQDHIRIVYQTQKTVLSDIFSSAQGLETAAFHVPVFRDGKYNGSIGILVDYEYIADKYFRELKVGETGHSFVLSEKGVTLFAPVREHIGKPAAQNYGSNPSTLSLLDKMRAGKEGTCVYVSCRPNADHAQAELHHAAFYPVRLYNTFWSICVSAPDSEILSHIEGFRNRYFTILFFLAIIGVGFSYYLIRFYLLRAGQEASQRAESERDRFESQLRQAQKLEAVGTLAGGIAHDFNNILTPIIGYTEMALIDPRLEPKLKKNFEQVLRAALRAKDLIGQILAFSRYTKEKPLEGVEIGSIMKDALKLLRASLPATIEIRQNNIETGIASADATQIHQIVVNLCTNASHAMDEKGVIEVSLTRVDLDERELKELSTTDLAPGPFLKLSVTDAGIGMDRQILERIFDPYFTTKEVGRGSGLGLAVVHGIVKRHSGAISVNSSPGEGSTFNIYFPVLEGVLPMASDLPKEVRTGTEKILLVDDEPSVLDVGAHILRSLGYQVTTATDGLQALALFKSAGGQFDLVITDYTMPNLTGADLAGEIKRIRPDMPIVLCTGYSQKLNSEDACKHGLEFVLKPFVLEELAGIVRRTLDAGT